MKHEEIRSYEVSIWTLQDEFITVLKWSNIEHKGTILDPKFTSIDDGTLSFSFSIPMYIRQDGLLIENPIWYNTLNDNLMANLKKIKIIFNKSTSDEKIVELLITKVTEEHELDHVFCKVECEGLAFNELGKIGYTYDLSSADLEYDYLYWQEHNEWYKADGTRMTEQPIGNILYWCEKIGLAPLPDDEHKDEIDPRKWYYTVEMNWDSFSGNRDKNTMYEEPYNGGWTYIPSELVGQRGMVIPTSTVNMREKERTIEVKESNIYNITLTIAETFGVFCEYEYGHDKNGHINKRVIKFFNNYLYDSKIMSLTYPYSSKKVTREMDSSAVTTKLYVRSLEDTTTLLGEANIRYSDANKMQEDYILNFEYLKESGNISEELYLKVGQYEDDIHAINAALYPVENKINVYENQVNDLKAKQTYYTNAIKLDTELITLNSDLALSLTVSDGLADLYISSFNDQHPDYTIITTDELEKYCIKLDTKVKGIRADSVKIYRNYTSSNNELSNPLTKFYFIYDEEYGFPTRIYGEEIVPGDNSYAVYMTYDYEPRLYYDAIVKTWEERLATDEKNLADITKQLSNDPENDGDENAPLGVELALEDAREELQELIRQKKKIMAEFNYAMGPALREGYWQPEKYNDYGERYLVEKSLSTSYDSTFVSTSTGNDYNVGWDTNLLDNEQDIYYLIGINNESEGSKVYYPCVNLTSIINNNEIKLTFLENLDKYSFVFYNNYYDENAQIELIDENTLERTSNVRYIRSFSIGSEAIVGFVKNSKNEVFPALILVGAKNMTTDDSIVEGGTIGFMLNQNNGRPRLSILTTTIEEKTVKAIETNIIKLNSEDYFKFGTDTIDKCVAVMPRLKFSSLMLKTSEDTLFVRYNNTLLKNYYDYYITNRLIQSEVYAPEYFITIKPFTLIKTGVLNGTFNTSYVLSNASTAIYLDALEVAEENSKPKVSYTVDPNILDRNLTRILYEKLNWVVMINDVLLKFNNAFGYISKLELDLDFPDKDAIEVKNYVTKFEDLFSTIVAQTEAMKLSSGVMGTVMAGDMPLSDEGLSLTLDNAQDMFEEYLDDYIDSSDRVREKLMSLFTEAGSILASTSRSMRDINSLTAENAEILGGFVLNINKELTSLVYTSNTKPSTYKLGDVWILTDDSGNVIGRYVATSSSGVFAADTETSGFARTFDGTLASITGASLDINADDGIVNIEAENEINIKSGNSIYIAANDTVEIVGNKKVNIGGTQINLCSLAEKKLNPSTGQLELVLDEENHPIIHLTTGINLIAGEYDEDGDYGDTSRILISPTSMEIGSAILTFKATASIDMIVSDITDPYVNKSAIKISADDGVWIGTGRSITLFSGGDTTGASGSSVLINTERILMGVTNTNDSSIFDLTPGYLVMGTGTTANNFDRKDVPLDLTYGQITGMKLTKDSFGLAVGTGAINNPNNEPVRTVILANSNGFIVGAGVTPKTSGSYVEITGGGIDIGSLGTLTVNTSNFKVLPNATGTNPIFYVGTGDILAADKYVRYSLDGGLEVRGNIINDQLAFINGSYTINNKTYSSGIYLTNTSATGAPLAITYNGSTYYAYINSSGKTYYSQANSGNTHTVTSDETLLTYNDKIVAVYPKYALINEEVSVYDTGALIEGGYELLYTYTALYISDGSSAVTYNGNKIEYDGSNSESSTWYLTLSSANLTATCANIEYSTGSELKTVAGSTMVGTLLTRNTDYEVTFSILAGTGFTTINTGLLGDFFISPQGLSSGTILGSKLINTAISGCTINSYNSGYYGRCFYDYSIDLTNNLLLLRRIDGTDVAINIASIAKSVKGTNTGSCSSCSSTCTSGCTGGCSANCASGCQAACASCSTNCGSSCTSGCGNNCGTSCSSGCQGSSASQCTHSDCTGGCLTSCSGTCSTGCSNGCLNTCTTSCTGGCYEGCRGGCTVGCAENCTTECSGDCTTSCSTTCATGCATTCSSDCTGSSTTCFLGGTLIKLANNSFIPIERLNVGMLVKAYDENTNSFVKTKVEAVLMFEYATNIYDVILSSGDIITLTATHPLLTIHGWKAIDKFSAMKEHWALINEMVVGDKMISDNEEIISITDIVKRDDLDGATVYNIDVEPYDNYLVKNIIAHNADVKGT